MPRTSTLIKHILRKCTPTFPLSTSTYIRTHATKTRGLYTFYPLFEVHLCTVTFGLMYGYYSGEGYSGTLKVHICIKNAKIREINYLSDNNVQILQSGISAAKPDPFSGFNPILDPIFF